MSEVKRMMNVFKAIYGLPEGENLELLTEAYGKALEGFQPETIRKAIVEVTQTYQPRYKQPWPVPAVVVEACRKVSESNISEAVSRHADLIRSKRAAKRNESKQLAAWWLESHPLGRQALLEGWHRELWNWVRQIYVDCPDDKRVNGQKVRFEPERIAYAQENCVAHDTEREFGDLWIIFGTEAKATEKIRDLYKQRGWDLDETKLEVRGPKEDTPFKRIGKPLDVERTHRDGFQQMQSASKNYHLHRTDAGLSEISKRMTGERE